MKTAVAADFEQHQTLRCLLWALLGKRISELETKNVYLTEFGEMRLEKLAQQVLASFHAGDQSP